MRRQKTERTQNKQACKCTEYKELEQKLTKNLIDSVKSMTGAERGSIYKLIKLQTSKYHEQSIFIEQIDSKLRDYIKTDLTIAYRQNMTILQMIDSLINKIKKQKVMHHQIMIKQTNLLKSSTEEQHAALQEIDYLKQLLSQEQKLQQAWKIEAIKHQKTIELLKQQIEKNTQEIKSLKMINQRLQISLKTLKDKSDSLSKENINYSKQYFQKCQQYTKLIKSFKSQKQQLTYRTKLQLNEQLAKYKLQISMELSKQKNKSVSFGKNTTKQNSYHLFNHLFAGQVLVNEDQSRQFLIQSIQNIVKNPINRTKLIYRFDPLNPINIHKYIDGIPHLVVLIQTEARQIIGAYSQGSFKPKTISNHLGLLISFKNKKVFRNIKKSIIYDENEIIFGNYDLRLRTGDNRIASNFGLANSFYETKGESINSLFGQGKNRQVRIKTYEIYQAILQK